MHDVHHIDTGSQSDDMHVSHTDAAQLGAAGVVTLSIETIHCIVRYPWASLALNGVTQFQRQNQLLTIAVSLYIRNGFFIATARSFQIRFVYTKQVRFAEVYF